MSGETVTTTDFRNWVLYGVGAAAGFIAYKLTRNLVYAVASKITKTK